jgi:hypothetical protein
MGAMQGAQLTKCHTVNVHERLKCGVEHPWKNEHDVNASALCFDFEGREFAAERW